MDDTPLFGTLALDRGWITRDELEAALLEQARSREEGDHRLIGAILVKRGWLEASQVQALLGDQGRVLLRCMTCRTPFTLPRDHSQGLACPRCGGPLDPPHPDDIGEGARNADVDPGTLYVIEDDLTDFSPGPLPLDTRQGPGADPVDATFAEDFDFPTEVPTKSTVRAPAPPKTAEAGPRVDDLPPGTRIGGCEIVSRIGRGGMGAVYQANHVGLKKKVALKVLVPPTGGRPDLITRFLTEARTAAKLDHPNVVPVMDVGQEGAIYYIVMHFVEGESLAQLIDRTGRLSVDRTLKIARQVAVGLQAAHEAGIIHRDVKPANVMLQPDGTAKIADFGLAKDIDSDGQLSRAGQVMGSPFYLSPEQAEGRPVDKRTDIYSLGVTLFQCLTGQRPFTASSPVGVLMKHLKDPAPDPRKITPSVPPAIAEMVHRMMAKQPHDRFASCKEVQVAIDAFLHPKALTEPVGPSESMLWKGVAAGALVVGLIVAGLAGAMAAGVLPAPWEWGRTTRTGSADREIETALALAHEIPPKRQEALDALRSILLAYGPESDAGRRARSEIETLQNAIDAEGKSRFGRASHEATVALEGRDPGAARNAVKGLGQSLAGSSLAEAGARLEQDVNRSALILEAEIEADRLAQQGRHDAALEPFALASAALPPEDAIFVEEARKRWLAARAALDQGASEQLKTLLARIGDPPDDPEKSALELETFIQTHLGTPAARQARTRLEALQRALVSGKTPEQGLGAAISYHEKHPDDLDGAIGRFELVAMAHAGSDAGKDALRRATALSDEREKRARQSLEQIRERTADGPPGERAAALRAFPEGLRGSRVYLETVLPELERLKQAQAYRGDAAAKALADAEAELEGTPRPMDGDRFRAIATRFDTVAREWEGTPQARAAKLRVERLRTDRRLAATRTYERVLKAASDQLGQGDRDGARASLEGFARTWSDSPLAEKALSEIERLTASQEIDTRRGADMVAFESGDKFAAENVDDPAAVLAHWQDVLASVQDPDVRDKVRKRRDRARETLEQRAGEALDKLLGEVAALEARGKRGEAVNRLSGFPGVFRGSQAFARATKARERREDQADKALGRAETLLERSPDDFTAALDQLGAVIREWEGTRWSTAAAARRKEVQDQAERAALRQIEQGWRFLKQRDYVKARAAFQKAARWSAGQAGTAARQKADHCTALIERDAVLDLVRAGRLDAAARRGREILNKPAFEPFRDDLQAAVDHAVNLKEGFLRVDGGAFRLEGRVVTLAPFYITRTEITNAEYRLFIVQGGYADQKYWGCDEKTRATFIDITGHPGPRHWRKGNFPEGKALHPVRYVSWYEARAYARWRGGDLPTAAQWMVAAAWDAKRMRLGAWPFGEKFDPERCWAGRSHDDDATTAVGSFPSGASPLGLLDCAGNVAEWVLDWDDPGRERYKVLKGGDSSDFDAPSRTRTDARDRAAPDAANPLSGFRIVRKGGNL